MLPPSNLISRHTNNANVIKLTILLRERDYIKKRKKRDINKKRKKRFLHLWDIPPQIYH